MAGTDYFVNPNPNAIKGQRASPWQEALLKGQPFIDGPTVESLERASGTQRNVQNFLGGMGDWFESGADTAGGGIANALGWMTSIFSPEAGARWYDIAKDFQSGNIREDVQSQIEKYPWISAANNKDRGGPRRFFRKPNKGEPVDRTKAFNKAQVEKFGGFDNLGISADAIKNLDLSSIDKDLIALQESLKDQPLKETAKIKRLYTRGFKPEDIGEEPVQKTNKQVVETETAEEKALVEGLDSFIEGVRGTGAPAPEVKSLEEYKQLLSDITGVDMSGKVDKSAALMSFGLALMQNRAGKGFNLGRMLGEVGKAGEVALPKLEAAKKEARAAAIEGGKFALTSQRADAASARAAEEKSMVRDKYWIYEKGGKGQEFANFDKGQFENLSMYEMNKLLSDPEFDKKYEFISAADRMSILQKRAEAMDTDTDSWSSKGYDRVSLIGGDVDEVPFELQVMAAMRDPNYKLKPGEYNMKLGESKENVIDKFVMMQESINKDAARFAELKANVESGVSLPKQGFAAIKQFFRAIGYTPPGGMPGTTQLAQQALRNFSIDNATDILKESGKTLSDGDRKLVNERVGQINFFSNDPVLIMNQIKDIYNFTIEKSQKNLDLAIRNLERDFGIVINPNMPTQEELDAMNKANGTNLTMDDFK